ncbi:MAG TPA: hypothetical protein VK463_11520 [Desulfomonilaceae bacterium]|nr:hypothetical protein [Desulfomonilaceae bacterium]
MTFKTKMIIAGTVILVIFLIGLYGYMSLPSVQQRISHAKSEAIGLDRTVTLYANDGKPIRTWKGRIQVELEGGAARFVVHGKAIVISGTYVIEEN